MTYKEFTYCLNKIYKEIGKARQGPVFIQVHTAAFTQVRTVEAVAIKTEKSRKG